MIKTTEIKDGDYRRRKSALFRIVRNAGIIIGTLLIICAAIFVAFPDYIINTFLKDRVTKALKEAYPAFSIRFGDIHYNVWQNRLGCDSLLLQRVDTTIAGSATSFSVSGIAWLKILWRRDVSPDIFSNSVIDARNIVLHFEPSQHELRLAKLHVSLPDSEIVTESIKYYSLQRNDSTITGSAASFSAHGIAWLKFLMQKEVSPHIFANSVMGARNILIHFPRSRQELRFIAMHLSIPDSDMAADSMKYYSLLDDEEFFAKSRFRQTRFRFDIPAINITGLDGFALLHGIGYKAGSVDIRDAFADILVNMDKPYDKKSTPPQMPGELLASIKEIIKIDSVIFTNGRFKYSERIAVKARPGVISIHDINATICGIRNHTSRPDTAVIYGEGILMKSGAMKLVMAIPLTPKDFSLQYSGSLGSMDATDLNSFLVPNEHRRITSGIVRSATYNINVVKGRASGAVRSVYKDLAIAVLDKKTGSSKGIFNKIASLYAKLFIIHGTNLKDNKGVVKIGKVQYRRKRDDYFLQFVWFALRSGVADIVGFTPQ